MLKQIIKEQWWLMYCDFPNRNWARLRVYSDSSANIFDMDGRTIDFSKEEEAAWYLREDEYTQLDNLDAEDEKELGCSKDMIKPPIGNTDKELLPQIYIKIQNGG